MAYMSPIKETSYDNGNGDINPVVAHTTEARQPLETQPSARACCPLHARQTEKAAKCAQWIAWVIIIATIIIISISGGLVFGGAVSFGSWTIGTLVLDSTTKIGLAILFMEGGSCIILLAVDYGVYRYCIHGASCPDNSTVIQSAVPIAPNTVTSTVDISNETLLLDETNKSKSLSQQSYVKSEQTPLYDSEEKRREHLALKTKMDVLEKELSKERQDTQDIHQEVDQVTSELKKVQNDVIKLQENDRKQDEMLSQLKKESEQLKANDRKQTKTLDDLETTLIVGKQKLQDLEKRMQRLEQTTHTTQPKQTSQTLIVVTMQPPNHKFIV